jgi:hypothetical protein
MRRRAFELFLKNAGRFFAANDNSRRNNSRNSSIERIEYRLCGRCRSAPKPRTFGKFDKLCGTRMVYFSCSGGPFYPPGSVVSLRETGANPGVAEETCMDDEYDLVVRSGTVVDGPGLHPSMQIWRSKTATSSRWDGFQSKAVRRSTPRGCS